MPVLNSIYYFFNIIPPAINITRKSTMKIKNKTLAILAAPAAIPVNPSTAAIIAIMKNVAAHLNIS